MKRMIDLAEKVTVTTTTTVTEERTAGNYAFILLDRSGSMRALWSEAIGSINGYVDKLPKDTHVYYALFDDVSYDVIRDVVASEFKPVSEDEYRPRGLTPLNDSVARITNKCLELSPEKATIVVMTDGLENCSKEHSRDSVKKLLDSAKSKGFENVFLGANFSSVAADASTYGVDTMRRAVPMSAGNFGNTMATLATKNAMYYNAPVGSAESAATMDFMADELKKAWEVPIANTAMVNPK